MKKWFLMAFVLSFILFLSSCDIVSKDGPFVINFESNGGTSLDAITVDQFDPFYPEFVPTKEGYTFGGWYIDENLYYPMTFHTGTNESLTLYAKWIANEEVMTRDDIITIINELLADENLVLADTLTLEAIVTDLLASGHAVDLEEVIERVLTEIDVIKTYETTITTMLEKIEQSVVMVETYSVGQVDGGGSGVLYKRSGNTYYLVTNDHVVRGYLEDNVSLTIFTDQGEVNIPRGYVTINGTSVLHDLAVLSFTLDKDLEIITFADKTELAKGQFVYAIGSPLDLPQTISFGVISSFDRPMWDQDGMDTIMVQHTAPINPGNSGGALVNSYGQLVGINDMSYVDEYVGEGIEGLHFAIQIDIVIQVIAELE